VAQVTQFWILDFGFWILDYEEIGRKSTLDTN
jgi:hypothetical protein